jgi:hypothetical protein
VEHASKLRRAQQPLGFDGEAFGVALNEVQEGLRDGQTAIPGLRLRWAQRDATTIGDDDLLADEQRTVVDIDAVSAEPCHLTPAQAQHGSERDHQAVALTDALSETIDVPGLQGGSRLVDNSKQVDGPTRGLDEEIEPDGVGEDCLDDGELAPDRAGGQPGLGLPIAEVDDKPLGWIEPICKRAIVLFDRDRIGWFSPPARNVRLGEPGCKDREVTGLERYEPEVVHDLIVHHPHHPSHPAVGDTNLTRLRPGARLDPARRCPTRESVTIASDDPIAER